MPTDDTPANSVPDTALQYRVRKLEDALLLERRLRHSKEEQTQVLRQRIRQLLQIARQARAYQHQLNQQQAAFVDPDATVLSQPHPPRLTESWTQPSKPAAQLALPLQFQLHEYRIDSVLGQGGFGITYLATDVNLNAKVAIKEYLPSAFAYRDINFSVQAKYKSDLSLYQTGLDNFLVEARTLATFRHPNIVRVARFFEAQHSAYIVLEYERGQALRTWWNPRKPLPEQELLALLQPLLDGLSLVHEAGYLHRDIKPDNIYVRHADGSLVLLDFGAAQHSSSSMQDMGAIVTPGYAPIEQYETQVQGPATDIYAFAATLYWMVAGTKPPPAPERLSGEQVMPAAQEVGRARYSDEFLRAIDWGLALKAEDRPQNITDFAQALFAAHSASLGLQAALQMDERKIPRLLDMRENWRMLLDSPRLLARRVQQLWHAAVHPGSWPMALKMTTALMMAALLPMLITAYYNLNGSIQAVSNSELRNLERLAQSVAGRIGQVLSDSGNLANYLATDPDFIRYLRHPNAEDEAAIYQKIRHLTRTNPDVHRLLLINAHGLVLIANDPAVVGRNSRFRDYFRAAMAGQSFKTSMLISIADASPGIFYSNPVYDEQRRVIGAVVLRIKGATIDHLLQESTQDTGRVPFLIDGDGVMISHPDKTLLYRSLLPLSAAKQAEIVHDQRFGKKPVQSLNMVELGQAMQGAKKHGFINYHSNISQTLEHAGYAPVPGHDWVVGITEPRSQFEAPLQELFSHVLYSVILVGLIFLLLAIWFARSIVRPVLRLTEAANALKEGDYERANIKVNTNDEIGRLARTFNVMIDVLRQRERERQRGRRQEANDENKAL